MKPQSLHCTSHVSFVSTDESEKEWCRTGCGEDRLKLDWLYLTNNKCAVSSALPDRLIQLCFRYQILILTSHWSNLRTKGGKSWDLGLKRVMTLLVGQRRWVTVGLIQDLKLDNTFSGMSSHVF